MIDFANHDAPIIGFTISLKEFYSTVPTLWKTSREWMNLNQKYLVPGDHPENLMKFVTDDNGESYNLCHFWSNFEVSHFEIHVELCTGN
jgi:alpha 1,2-mannosyltransferase